MNGRMENYNYWGDARVREGMINRGRVVEEGGRRYIVLGECLAEDEEDFEPIKVLCCWGVCDMCDGEGRHTNPSIDAGGICEGDEFWDNDWVDDEDHPEGGYSRYASGAYDITCSRCAGKRVEPVVDRNRNDANMLKRYDEWMKDEYDSAAESAAERQMGA